ncbi:MAG TPA: hypothetical protein GXZ89_05270 [Fastidiosipila sp.]|jgi:CobQ-like glutamine amidotransferase family enzyme|nr:hypothetical protein [Fastidiosipila sp.]
MKTIEYLFYDAGTLFGDYGHYYYFDQLFASERIIRTGLNDTPAFINEPVDLVYLGAMNERHQIMAAERLLPFRDRLISCIENGMHFLATCTAMDILGQSIDYEGKTQAMLGLFDFTVKFQRWPRINQFVYGEWNGIELTGHKSQFTKTTFGPGMDDRYFFKTKRGMGANPTDTREGIHYKHVYATQCMGPFFVINPGLMKHILRELDLPDDLPAEAAAFEAHANRLVEFKHPRASQAMEVS